MDILSNKKKYERILPYIYMDILPYMYPHILYLVYMDIPSNKKSMNASMTFDLHSPGAASMSI
jgi:hypothetical protein